LSFDFLLDEVGKVPLLLPPLSSEAHDAFVGRSDDQEIGGLVGVQVTLGGQLIEAGFQMSSPVLFKPVVNLTHAGSRASWNSFLFLDWHLLGHLGGLLE